MSMIDLLSARTGRMSLSLFGASSLFDAPQPGDFLALFQSRLAGQNDLNGASSGLSASGRNLSLFDPESAYRMMTEINRREISYQAEFAEMSEMGARVAGMQQAGNALAAVEEGSTLPEAEAAIVRFVGAYNQWIDRFDEGLAAGGLLADTQAAAVSQRALEQSMLNPFNGAAARIRGMEGLGVTIDQATNQARFDPAQLARVWADQPTGVVDTLQDFGSQFARSAELLNSAGNFIPNRLDNLDRVIDYIADHRSALQAEFGLGDAPRPSGELARALASYRMIQETAKS